MNTCTQRFGTGIILGALVFFCFSVPGASYAQTADPSVLTATIHAEILKDPRSAGLSAAEVDAMANALASQAAAQGITAQAIAYRPGALVPQSAVSYQTGICTDISSPLCTLGQALGFDNPDKEVPIGLWITSGLLIAIIWHMRRNPHLTASTPVQKPPSAGPLG